MLALCVTAASAATMNTNIVAARVTLSPVTTATSAYATCPAGYDCLTEADATSQLGTYLKYSNAICGYKVNTATLAAVIRTPQYCVKKAATPTCPEGCNCISEATAKARYGDYTRCSADVCGYEQDQTPKYCIKQGSTTPTCPEGCTCLSDARAKERYGTYTRCTENVCGYETSTLTTAAYQIPKYCVKQGSTTPTCPEGCSCMSEATAKAQGGTWSRCSADICGYEQDTSILTAVVQVPKYCMKQESTTPTCPEGCTCLTDAIAKQRYGTYTRCSADVCGFELGASTNALSSNIVAKFCVKQGSTAVCPDGCTCISDEDAKLKGLTERCDNSQTPCGYKTADATTTSAARRIPLYCYKLPTTTPTCPEGCNCLSEAKAKERYGTYTQCTAEICGKEVVPAANGVAAYSVPQYCVKQGSTPVCPDGCACISDEDAKLKGLTDRCDNSQTPCGFRLVAGTANTAATRVPLYCYKIPTTTPVCPQGCYCLQEADAKLKFGPNNYTRCQADICGYDPSATTANGIPKYCFKPTNTPTPSVCPGGCACTTNATAVEKGLTFCGGTLTSCGYNENKQPQYCFEQVSTPTCVYDYQKNVCTGTCDQGYTCGLLASKKDATGKVVYAACGCTGQPTTPCTYDTQKNACTGTCQTGAACSVVGKNVDEKTGATTPVCGCPQSSSCVYDYSKESCIGTCTGIGETCQLNTIYRDPTTGKVTYAECHCKGTGEVPETCTCDAASGSCTGTCADNRACTMTERTTDNAGKVVCSKCECRDTCVLTANNECSGTCTNQQPCIRIVTKDDSGQEKVSCGCGGVSQMATNSGVVTRQPGILEAIASFFSKLFGGK